MTSKTRHKEASSGSRIFSCGPAFPHPANYLIQELKNAIDRTECVQGSSLSQIGFGNLCGIPRSTINDWLCTNFAAQVRRFLCGFERLSEAERSRFLNRVCRDCPRINHPRLRHDRENVNTLAEVLKRPSGLTFVVGAEEHRSFITTALGNSVTMLNEKERVMGFDVHVPTKFSPVPGVNYLVRQANIEQIIHHVLDAWPAIEPSKAQTLLINGIWSNAPAKLQQKIKRISKVRRVIVADEFKSSAIGQIKGAHVIKVSRLRAGPRLLLVRAQA